MNQSEELENLKKELFKIDFSLKMKRYKDSLEHKQLLEQKHDVMQTIEVLKEEMLDSEGQIGFAFTDLIEIRK